MKLSDLPVSKRVAIEGYGKNESSPNVGVEVTNFATTTLVDLWLTVKSNDALPIVFYSETSPLIGGALLNLQQSLTETLYKNVNELLKDKAIKPEDLVFVFGPSLTFSHCPIDESLVTDLLNKDYRLALKGVNNEPHLDVPLLNALQLRKLGVPFSNIHLTNLDTLESDAILYSASRGDTKTNSLEIKLISKI